MAGGPPRTTEWTPEMLIAVDVSAPGHGPVRYGLRGHMARFTGYSRPDRCSGVGWPENSNSTAILRTRFQRARASGGDSGADSHRAVSGLTDAALADLLESCPEPGDLCLGTRGLLPVAEQLALCHGVEEPQSPVLPAHVKPQRLAVPAPDPHVELIHIVKGGRRRSRRWPEISTAATIRWSKLRILAKVLRQGGPVRATRPHSGKAPGPHSRLSRRTDGSSIMLETH